MNKKRVVILHYAAPPVVGGVESTIDHHARQLVRAGFKVDVIAGRGEPFHPQVNFYPIPEIDSRHPKVLEIGHALSQGKVPAPFYDMTGYLVERLHPLLGDTSACIVHNAITLHKNLPLTAALRRLSEENLTPMIAWCHDFAWQDRLYTPDLHPGFPWDLLRQPWPGVRYVVVSEHRRSRLAELMGLTEKDIQVVTPGVDASEFLDLKPLTQKLVARFELLAADPFLLLPARITRRKNIEFAIRVTAVLKAHKPRAALVITGPPGPHNPKNQAYLASLQELRKMLGVDDNVHFLHEAGEEGRPLHIPDSIVADLYRLADLLFFPSRREGFGIPVLEAGLGRLPVFAADIPPVRESAGEVAHLFDPDGNPEEVAVAILEQLKNDPAYRLRHRVIEHFTWSSIVNNQLIPLIAEGIKT